MKPSHSDTDASNPPKRRSHVVAVVSLVLVIVLYVGWRRYVHPSDAVSPSYDDPATFATMPITPQEANSGKVYRNERFGFEIKYPENYFLDPSTSSDRYISLRQDTTSAGQCKTSGKRIGLNVCRLEQDGSTTLGGYSIALTQDSTVNDIAPQFVRPDNRPLVQRNCYQRVINGTTALICTLRAPGEAVARTGGIYEVFVLGVHEMKNGERILIRVSNDAGGTPYTGDRALRRDVLRVFHTLRRI